MKRLRLLVPALLSVVFVLFAATACGVEPPNRIVALPGSDCFVQAFDPKPVGNILYGAGGFSCWHSYHDAVVTVDLEVYEPGSGTYRLVKRQTGSTLVQPRMQLLPSVSLYYQDFRFRQWRSKTWVWLNPGYGPGLNSVAATAWSASTSWQGAFG